MVLVKDRKIIWTDYVKHEEVLLVLTATEESNILHAIK